MLYVVLTVLVLSNQVRVCKSIACFTCSGRASNELQANVNCLQKSSIQNCQDFYEYYDNVDNQDLKVKSSTGVHLNERVEHVCYSSTIKNGWEDYKVEKGCQKKEYCKHFTGKKKSDEKIVRSKQKNFKGWVFCCPRSRCNTKIVFDKPQRVLGQKCRRTSDCIQGHTYRPVCPQYFKSCPRLPLSLVKMNCLGGPTNRSCQCLPGFDGVKAICIGSSSKHHIDSSILIAFILYLFLIYIH